MSSLHLADPRPPAYRIEHRLPAGCGVVVVGYARADASPARVLASAVSSLSPPVNGEIAVVELATGAVVVRSVADQIDGPSRPADGDLSELRHGPARAVAG